MLNDMNKQFVGTPSTSPRFQLINNNNNNNNNLNGNGISTDHSISDLSNQQSSNNNNNNNNNNINSTTNHQRRQHQISSSPSQEIDDVDIDDIDNEYDVDDVISQDNEDADEDDDDDGDGGVGVYDEEFSLLNNVLNRTDQTGWSLTNGSPQPYDRELLQQQQQQQQPMEQVITALQMNSRRAPKVQDQDSNNNYNYRVNSSNNNNNNNNNNNVNNDLNNNLIMKPALEPTTSLRVNSQLQQQPITEQQPHQQPPTTTTTTTASTKLVIPLTTGAAPIKQQQPKQLPFVLDPAGQLYYHWSMVVSIAFVYNFWAISYRFSFTEINFDTMPLWFALDYGADLIYVLDVVVNLRTGYLEEGVLQRNISKIRQHYSDCTLFYLDCFCLLPLDILYLSFGFNSIFRIPRLVKIYKFWSWTDRTERHTNYPNVYRTFTLVHYILVIFHWNACLFHMISKNKILDIESLYKIEGNQCSDLLCQYLHAFYWSTLALTTVGDLPRPRTKGEFLYVSSELFFGLFLFASVLGHVANIVTNVSAARKEFQAKLDAAKTFMRMRRVSDELQSKVIRWFDYLWNSQQNSDEERSVACLPDRLKAELAIHVHLDTLKRVDIFQNTEAGFLCELVLRLRPVLFSPGDYVCRKNEVGHEMYIISRGILEVVTNEGKLVVATLKAGSYFGEIAVLNVGQAGNKRTASVRSVGYTDLLSLNKQDLWDVLKNYPAAEARIRARAEERLSSLAANNHNTGGGGASGRLHHFNHHHHRHKREQVYKKSRSSQVLQQTNKTTTSVTNCLQQQQQHYHHHHHHQCSTGQSTSASQARQSLHKQHQQRALNYSQLLTNNKKQTDGCCSMHCPLNLKAPPALEPTSGHRSRVCSSVSCAMSVARQVAVHQTQLMRQQQQQQQQPVCQCQCLPPVGLANDQEHRFCNQQQQQQVDLLAPYTINIPPSPSCIHHHLPGLSGGMTTTAPTITQTFSNLALPPLSRAQMRTSSVRSQPSGGRPATCKTLPESSSKTNKSQQQLIIPTRMADNHHETKGAGVKPDGHEADRQTQISQPVSSCQPINQLEASKLDDTASQILSVSNVSSSELTSAEPKKGSEKDFIQSSPTNETNSILDQNNHQRKTSASSTAVTNVPLETIGLVESTENQQQQQQQ